MLFDVQAALAEILGNPPATPATPATRAPEVAEVAEVAAAHGPDGNPEAPAEGAAPDPDAFPYGVAVNRNPRTWTGRVVSLADWRTLSAWERHGSTGQIWNGISRKWEAME